MAEITKTTEWTNVLGMNPEEKISKKEDIGPFNAVKKESVTKKEDIGPYRSLEKKSVTKKDSIGSFNGLSHNEDGTIIDPEEYKRAVEAEEYYRKTHGGHSRIGSILRDGYKEPERDKNELQDYEIEARRED